MNTKDMITAVDDIWRITENALPNAQPEDMRRVQDALAGLCHELEEPVPQTVLEQDICILSCVNKMPCCLCEHINRGTDNTDCSRCTIFDKYPHFRLHPKYQGAPK